MEQGELTGPHKPGQIALAAIWDYRYRNVRVCMGPARDANQRDAYGDWYLWTSTTADRMSTIGENTLIPGRWIRGDMLDTLAVARDLVDKHYSSGDNNGHTPRILAP